MVTLRVRKEQSMSGLLNDEGDAEMKSNRPFFFCNGKHNAQCLKRMGTNFSFIAVALLVSYVVYIEVSGYNQASSEQSLLQSLELCEASRSIPQTIEPQPLTVDSCRSVFQPKGMAGDSSYSKDQVQTFCSQPLVYDVCSDLKSFTGLTEKELDIRLRRLGRFHFEGEHAFWNPTTVTELAWYYTTSIDYLFANAVHAVISERLQYIIDNRIEPVLDYSGGVGNNVLHLAYTHGLSAQYFGIGLAEYSFALYRVRSRQLTDKVTFLLPYSESTAYKFDPVNGPLPRNGTLGAILAMDVLEHIPNYHKVVEAMVDSIRVGGVISECSPFSNGVSNTEIEGLVHLSDGGVSMTDAMGPRMKFNEEAGVWIKVAE